MYERKVWVNRQSEHPARRKLTPTGNDGEYDVSRSEGIIMEDGDAFDADTMNDLERRVAAGFTELDPTGAGGGEVTVQPYTCEKKNGVYALVGSGAVGRCKIPASWAAGDSFTVNGAAVPAYCGADAVDGDTIVKGRWVLFFYDGTQLNFNGGGGLSASKLALATATEDNVLAGNKFYAGSKTIKEGTLTLTGNVTADKMLEGSSGYADDAHSIVAGSMPNRGSWGASLSPGGVATVPSGYHNGSGQVTAVSLKTSEVASISLEQGMKKEIQLKKDCQFVILYTNGYDYYGSAGVTATVEDLMLVASNEIPSVYTPHIGQTNTLTLPETVYGGEVDAVTGEGQETWQILNNPSSYDYYEGAPEGGWSQSEDAVAWHLDDPTLFPYHTKVLSNIFNSVSDVVHTTTPYTIGSNNHFIAFRLPRSVAATGNDVKNWLASNDVKIAFETIDRTPFTATGAQPIPALAGANTVLTDADRATVTGRADPIKRITDLEDATASQT